MHLRSGFALSLFVVTIGACRSPSDPGPGSGGGQLGGADARLVDVDAAAPGDDGGDGESADAAPTPVADTDPEWPAAEPLPPEFDLPPWVTLPAADRIVISWKTVAESTGRIHLGKTPDYDRVVETASSATLHHVDVGVIEPATAYYYEVEVVGTSARRRGVFVTPGASRWRWMHFGEFHAPSYADEAAGFVEEIRDFRPHLLVESGDMVDTGTDAAHWRSYFRAQASWISNVIILPAHSNHVNGFGGNSLLLSYFVLPNNERWYPTRYGQVQFLSADSTYGVNPDVNGSLPGWLEDRAAEAHDGVDDPALLVAAWHYPACSSNFAERASARRWIMDNLVDSLIAGGGVDLIVVAHDKYFERSLIDGTIHHLQTNIGSISPADEGDNHPRCTALATDTDTRSLGLFEVDGDTMQVDVVDDSGSMLDHFVVQR